MFDNSSISKRVLFFRNLYLGETFLCYIYLKNESSQTIYDIILKAEIDTATSHIPILGPKIFSKLDPYASIDVIVKHEVKEHGSVKYDVCTNLLFSRI